VELEGDAADRCDALQYSEKKPDFDREVAPV
jgi:hypothetical protein